MSDDHLLFLKQLGVRWTRIEFGKRAMFDEMRATEQCLSKFGMKIFSVWASFASRRLQQSPALGNDVRCNRYGSLRAVNATRDSNAPIVLNALSGQTRNSNAVRNYIFL